MSVDWVVSSNEAGPELSVAGSRDGGRNGPGHDRQVKGGGGTQGCVGGSSVVGVAGDATVVEHEQGRWCGVAGGVHLHGRDAGEVAWDGVERRGLTMRVAQDRDPTAGIRQGAEEGTEAERLVVGVGADGEDAVDAGRCVIHRRAVCR